MGTESRGRDALIAFVTLISVIAGTILGNYLDFNKTLELRAVEAKTRARETAWNQTAEAFQKLFGLRIRLRGNLVTYRDAAIRANYHARVFQLTRVQQHAQLELHFREVVLHYTDRVIDDRAEVQGILGWLQYVVPQQDQSLATATEGLLNLQLWYPPAAPQRLSALDAWRDEQTHQAATEARKEIDDKFAALLTTINAHRETLLREPARRFLEQIDEDDS